MEIFLGFSFIQKNYIKSDGKFERKLSIVFCQAFTLSKLQNDVRIERKSSKLNYSNDIQHL